MIGSARNALTCGQLPVTVELRILEIAALGSLDKGKGHPGQKYTRPINLVLKARHVDAMHRKRGGAARAEIDRRIIAEPLGCKRWQG